MTPYYDADGITLYHGDCREVMPSLGQFDAVFADPPYGIGKAEWDSEFPTDWLYIAADLAPTLAVTPGVWNVFNLPPNVGPLKYRWTLAAHLRNGRGRGALGRGNWIPCIVYTREEAVEWTRRFADWCEANGVSRKDLDVAAGTSNMGGHWTGRHAHRCQIPAPGPWQRIRAAFKPPSSFDEYVYAADPMIRGLDSASFVIGQEPMADHPSPKPLDVMTWFLARLPGYQLPSRGVLDPFAGSGTTLLAARMMDRRAVGIEVEERYCEVIATRLAQGDLFGETA